MNLLLKIRYALCVTCASLTLESCNSSNEKSSKEVKKESVDIRFKNKLSDLNNGDPQNVDIEILSKWISQNEFSPDEVMYWLESRKLTNRELVDLKKGVYVDGEDRNASFKYLGQHSPNLVLKYYYNEVLNINSHTNNRLVIPERQSKWADQYLNSILLGWSKSNSPLFDQWLKVMKQKFDFAYK